MENMENTQNTENTVNEKDSQTPKWYVLQTLSGYEKMVQSNLFTMVENNNLQDYIVDIVVPEEEEIVEKSRFICHDGGTVRGRVCTCDGESG